MSRDRRLDEWTEPPLRWRACPPMGDILEELFLPFKTPLDGKYDQKLTSATQFSVMDVFNAAQEKKKKIFLWVDMTSTSRFYDQTEVEKRGSKYRKMACDGHRGAPTPQQTSLFADLCEKTLAENPAALIGIHCTHGFNRTGFMICSYLVKKFYWRYDQLYWNSLRQDHPVSTSGTIKALYARFDDPDNAPKTEPEQPQWCVAGEADAVLDDEGNSVARDMDGAEPSRDGGFSLNTHGGGANKDAAFMEGVPRVAAVEDQKLVQEIRNRCATLCGWKRNGFPDCQPVSTGITNIQLIHNDPYYVSWKADGVRCMLFVDGEDRAFFLDRNCVFHVNGMSFPQRKSAGQQLEDTLMDGEMKLELGKLSFDKRCDYIQREIIGPRERDCQAGKIRKDEEPFSLRWKTFWPLITTTDAEKRPTAPQCMTDKLLGKKFSESLSHEVDGLVFQPVRDPYTAGRYDRVLKWKPPHLCTVDFRLQVKTEGGAGMIPRTKGLLFVDNQNSPFGILQNMPEMRKYDDKILECRFDQKSNKWIFLRERTDKSFPNAKSTAESVYEGIIRPLTQEMLLQYIKDYSYGRQSVKRPREPDHYQPPSRSARTRIVSQDTGAPWVL